MKKNINVNDVEISFDWPDPKESFQSVFIFGVHKSGSTLLRNIVSDLAAYTKIPAVSLPDIFFNSGLPIDRVDRETLLPIKDYIRETGYIYNGGRTFWCKPLDIEINKFKKILLVRDPRDAIVSYFFSDKNSHPIPENLTGWQESREELKNIVNINDSLPFIRSKIGWLSQTYREYLDLIQSENIVIYRYEDIIFNKRNWVKELSDYMGLDLDLNNLHKIADKHDIVPNKESPNSHIRSVVPGNYTKHLNRESQTLIEEELDFFFDFFGYNDLSYMTK